MERTHATEADAAAVTEIVVAIETAQYGASAYTQADLEEEWAGLDRERDTFVIRDGGDVVGYGAVREREGDLARVEGYVHPGATGRGIGALVAGALEENAVRGGASRVQNSVFEVDTAARELLDSLGYRLVRIFREMRIELDGPPPAPRWPDGLRVEPFDPERDGRAFHAASQEAFADHWDHVTRDFESWSRHALTGDRFDPSLFCVVRAGDEIAAGTRSTADTYGGGWVHAVFTRRPWRRQGVGEALLLDAFARFWERGERSVGLGVDADSDTGAFRLYERAGMTPALGWVMYEKAVSG